MLVARKSEMFAPDPLRNAMSFINTGVGVPLLKSVPSGNFNTVTHPDSDLEEEAERIPGTPKKVEALVCATDQQRMDAWFKLHCPARNVCTKGKKRKVEQVTHDGEVVMLTIRQRVGGKLPVKAVAIGSGKSTAKVQVLDPEVIAARQARSNNARANGAGVPSAVTMYVSPLADKEVLDQFKADVEARKRMDRETLMACMLNSRRRHAIWQRESGGSTVRERLYQGITHGSAPVVEDKAANDSCNSSDSNIEQFREEEVNGVLIGTAHPSHTKFMMVGPASTVEAQQASANHAKLDRSTHAYQHGTSGSVCHFNTLSLSTISAIDNAEGHRYLQWLESRELDNPIIDSSRIKHGRWLDHISVSHCSEVVKRMSRLNDASNYRKGIVARKKLGAKITRGVAAHCVFEKVYGVTAPTAMEVAETTGAATVYKTSVISSFSNSVEESVRPDQLIDAINAAPIGVYVNGTWVEVTREKMFSAMLYQAQRKGGKLPIL